MKPAQPCTSIVTGTPLAEIVIDDGLALRLLAEQHPDLAHLPLRGVDAGWDNALFRLGDDLALRFPRRLAAAKLIATEQCWLPRLSKFLPLPVPVPYRIGKPGLGYPWCWSVLPWLKGMTADTCEPSVSQAVPFARFLRSLHVPAPIDAPTNPFRGVPLQQRVPGMEARLQRLVRRSHLVTKRIRNIWDAALAAPLDVAPTWLHGDLHPRNVLIEGGRITGIIDWGDLTSGDCATDLAAAWMLFEPDARGQLLAEYAQRSQATLSRTKGWAMLFAVTLLDTGLVDNPRNAAIGERILRRLVADPG